MITSLIAAMDNNRVIGKQNKMPWHVGSDLKSFKALTKNKPVIMGRKTFESLPFVLPDRPNIVITKDKFFSQEGVTVFHNIQDAIDYAQNTKLPPDLPAEEIMIIGGAQIFEMTIEEANRIYLTQIDTVVNGGDAFFPKFEQDKKWKLSVTKELEKSNQAEFKATLHVYDKEYA